MAPGRRCAGRGARAGRRRAPPPPPPCPPWPARSGAGLQRIKSTSEEGGAGQGRAGRVKKAWRDCAGQQAGKSGEARASAERGRPPGAGLPHPAGSARAAAAATGRTKDRLVAVDVLRAAPQAPLVDRHHLQVLRSASEEAEGSGRARTRAAAAPSKLQPADAAASTRARALAHRACPASAPAPAPPLPRLVKHGGDAQLAGAQVQLHAAQPGAEGDVGVDLQRAGGWVGGWEARQRWAEVGRGGVKVCGGGLLAGQRRNAVLCARRQPTAPAAAAPHLLLRQRLAAHRRQTVVLRGKGAGMAAVVRGGAVVCCARASLAGCQRRCPPGTPPHKPASAAPAPRRASHVDRVHHQAAALLESVGVVKDEERRQLKGALAQRGALQGGGRRAGTAGGAAEHRCRACRLPRPQLDGCGSSTGSKRRPAGRARPAAATAPPRPSARLLVGGAGARHQVHQCGLAGHPAHAGGGWGAAQYVRHVIHCELRQNRGVD